jgi:hypothetical protein
MESLTDPKLAIIIAVLFARFKNATYRFPFIGITLNLVGTLLHELAHFFIALVLNGRPTSFTILPRRQGDMWVFGSVEITNSQWYNALPIAMAPLLLFLAAYFLDRWYIAMPIEKTLWSDFGYLMALVILVENAIPSTQDFKVAFSKIFGVLFFSALFGYFFFHPIFHIL